MIQSIEDGRKEDGNRSIADKIIKRLHDLEMTVQSNFGRWAWELLQNAKDSVADTNRKVSVQITFDKTKIEFRHNGNHFTEKDIRGLINQISSKEVEEGEVFGYVLSDFGKISDPGGYRNKEYRHTIRSQFFKPVIVFTFIGFR